jgi:hypothetical protein
MEVQGIEQVLEGVEDGSVLRGGHVGDDIRLAAMMAP